MFTGIIDAQSKLLSVQSQSGKKLLCISKPDSFSDLKSGSSIACDGICLTVLEYDSRSFKVEIMNETLQKSTAKSWQPGRILNLERALQIGSRLDGHWLQGHIDRELRLISHHKLNNTDYLRFELQNADRALVVPQGSIALNGTSLTIADLKSDSFSVALIGHTLSNSNLSSLKPGDKVNVEYDILGKYVLRIKGI